MLHSTYTQAFCSYYSFLSNKLSPVSGLNCLEREIENQVGSHYEDLLSQATGVETLEDVLNTMHTRIQVLTSLLSIMATVFTDLFCQMFTVYHVIRII